MESFLPRDIVYRRKSGFALPLPEWFRKDLYGLAREVMLRPGNALSVFLNLQYIEQMLERHRSGARDLSFELWALLLLEYWFQEYHVTP
jgi:asparagine synthase (glutamine-hydrolysing)